MLLSSRIFWLIAETGAIPGITSPASFRRYLHERLIDPTGIVRWEGLPSLPGYELTEDVVEEILRKYSKPLIIQ